MFFRVSCLTHSADEVTGGMAAKQRSTVGSFCTSAEAGKTQVPSVTAKRYRSLILSITTPGILVCPHLLWTPAMLMRKRRM